jgi:hypothetical protein
VIRLRTQLKRWTIVSALAGRLGAIALALIILGVSLLWHILAGSPLDHAVTILKVSAGPDGIEFGSHGWTPPNTMLGFSKTGTPEWNAFIRRYDTETTVRLDAFKTSSRKLSAPQPPWVRWVISPDGRKLLWGGSRPGDTRFFTSSLDGTNPTTMSFQERFWDYDITWSRDSLSWFILERKRGVNALSSIRHLDTSRAGRRTCIVVASLRLEPYLVGILPNGQFLTASFDESRFSRFDPFAPGQTVTRFTSSCSQGYDGTIVTVSPKGNRLAWCAVKSIVRPQLPALAWLHERMHPGNMRVDLFVTDLEGKRRIDLGSLEITQWSEGGSDHASVYGWTADGKHILFWRGPDGQEELVSVSVPD